MDQRELLRKGEGSTPDRFSIVLVLHLKDPDALIQEGRQFGAIVTDWHKARGASSEGVILAAVADPKYHKAVKDWFEGVHSMDVTLRPIFETVLFRIELHNPDGARVAEHEYPPRKRVRGGFVEKLLGALRGK
jgi:hypothetical protein